MLDPLLETQQVDTLLNLTHRLGLDLFIEHRFRPQTRAVVTHLHMRRLATLRPIRLDMNPTPPKMK